MQQNQRYCLFDPMHSSSKSGTYITHSATQLQIVWFEFQVYYASSG